MARAGEPVTTIQAWLGHSDLKTTQRYMHYAPAADAAERVERAFVVAQAVLRRGRWCVVGRRGRSLPRSVMSDPPDDPIAPLIRALDEASRTLAGIASLIRAETERIGVRITASSRSSRASARPAAPTSIAPTDGR
jgi:hypothetical protein